MGYAALVVVIIGVIVMLKSEEPLLGQMIVVFGALIAIAKLAFFT